MSLFKYAFAFCAMLFLTLIPHGSAKAQSDGSKSGESKIEVGAQFSVIGKGTGSPFDNTTGIGGGGRLTFNLTKYFALEGELNYFPSSGFDNVRRFQGQFGVKSGLRYDRFGVFGKVRPGFINTRSSFSRCLPSFPVDFGSVVCLPFELRNADTRFSLDVGGVVEFYPVKRITMRIDVGDTIVNRQESTLLISQPISLSPAPPNLATNAVLFAPVRNGATHNLQLSAGVGFRF
jgi:hypothetical protein